MLRSRKADVDDWYPKKGSYKWWDGYTNQRGLIWDEFRYACVAGHGGLMALLNVCDRMPLDVEIKGGIVRLRADCIVITSAYDLSSVSDIGITRVGMIESMTTLVSLSGDWLKSSKSEN